MAGAVETGVAAVAGSEAGTETASGDGLTVGGGFSARPGRSVIGST